MDVERSIRMQPSSSGTSSLDAYQHFVTAVSLLRQYAEGVNERARDHLDEALRLDPGFALAHAYRGLAEVILNDYSWASRSTLEGALEHMQRGLQIAPEEARCHWIIGMTRLFMRQHASAELHLRRAIELNPSDPDMLAVMGYLETMRGRPEDGVVSARRAIALNPLHPSWYHTDIATSLHAAGQYGEAIAHLQMLLRIDPFWHTRLAACHAALGDTAAAARHMAEAKKISPGWDPVEEYRQGLEVEHPESLEPILRDIELAVAAWRFHCG